MSRLLRHPTAPDAGRAIHRITPESAGWNYVGFDVLQLEPGQQIAQPTGGREVCLVLISGRAAVQAGSEDFGTIGSRGSPFEGSPGRSTSRRGPTGCCGRKRHARWRSAPPPLRACCHHA